jgi:hypothetical protein
MNFASKAQEAAFAMKVLADMQGGKVYYLVLANDDLETLDELSRICSNVIPVSKNRASTTPSKTKSKKVKRND